MESEARAVRACARGEEARMAGGDECISRYVCNASLLGEIFGSPSLQGLLKNTSATTCSCTWVSHCLMYLIIACLWFAGKQKAAASAEHCGTGRSRDLSGTAGQNDSPTAKLASLRARTRETQSFDAALQQVDAAGGTDALTHMAASWWLQRRNGLGPPTGSHGSDAG